MVLSKGKNEKCKTTLLVIYKNDYLKKNTFCILLGKISTANNGRKKAMGGLQSKIKCSNILNEIQHNYTMKNTMYMFYNTLQLSDLMEQIYLSMTR